MTGRDINRRIFDVCTELMQNPADSTAGDRRCRASRPPRVPVGGRLRSRTAAEEANLRRPARSALLPTSMVAWRWLPEARDADAAHRESRMPRRPPDWAWSIKWSLHRTLPAPPAAWQKVRKRAGSRGWARGLLRRSISTSRRPAHAKEVMSMNALAADAQEGIPRFWEARRAGRE